VVQRMARKLTYYVHLKLDPVKIKEMYHGGRIANFLNFYVPYEPIYQIILNYIYYRYIIIMKQK
jgi:hypothetical protein